MILDSEPVGSTLTGVAGSYSLPAPSGVFDVRFEPSPSEPFEPTTVHDVSLESSRALSVVLVAAGLVHLTGTLRDSSGEPVPDAELSLACEGEGEEESYASHYTGAEGAYSLAVLPGECTLEVAYFNSGTSLPDRWWLRTQEFSLDSDQSRDITLPPTSKLTVEALGEGDAPIANAQVTIPPFEGTADVGGIEGVQFRGQQVSKQTGEDGRASFHLFHGTAGTARLTPLPESGYGPTSFALAPIEEDATVPVHPPAHATVHLTGTLRDSSGEPVPDAELSLACEGEGEEESYASHYTGAEGAYSLAVLPGECTLEVAYFNSGTSLPDRWWLRTQEFSLDSDQSRDITLPPTSKLTVEALGEGDAPIAGAQVTIPPFEGTADIGAFGEASFRGQPVFKQTGEDGQATFSLFKGAAGTVRFSPLPESGYGPTSFSLAPIEEDTTTVVRFQPPTAAAAVSLTSNHNPSVRGQRVEFTARVTAAVSGSPTPTGMVEFRDGATALGTASLNSRGVAKFSTASLSTGEHQVFAKYIGDGRFGPSESAPLVQVVGRAATELLLKSSREPAPYGSATNLTATLKVLRPGSGTPGGSIVFLEHGSPVATVPLEGKKSAVYPLKGHQPGTDAFQAVYSGDAGYEASESAPLSQTITKAATELVLKSSRNPVSGTAPATLTATVKVLSPGSGIPTGNVVVLEDGAPIATLPLPVGKKAVKLSLKGYPHGVFEFAAAYEGDEDYEASESAPLVQLIAPYAPEVTGLDPAGGPEPGGTRVSIEGQNLAHATEVRFGSTPAQSFEVTSPTTIDAVSPPGAGTVDVSVTTPGGTSGANAADKFSYLPPQPVDAYSNYGSATLGHAMCRGNPERPESMPGGTATQTFVIPSGVASLSSATVDIDPDATVTAHLTLKVNGTTRATTSAAAIGNTRFSWPAVAVEAGDAASLSISFTATFGKIITVYSAAAVGGTLTYSNSCSDGAPSGSTPNGLRAVVSGLSP